MTISEIKYLSEEKSPYFFSRDTLKFFHQTMRDFKVYKQKDGRFFITAPMRDHSGKVVGHTERYFNPINNELERIIKN